ncbi:50S ribosomal protein L7/L12 [Candidatus Giovannonibacteria bacterium RIFCSPLOWO2_02_FULL_43_11b]|uniref:Large ribosomal subunit protein bL12 n=1 Tax=Candidatus Giovannonibacteria bacterium RIFCSPHIGHO2_12_FULL_43_15 TaxID=1798341 RepID=A0A1F5WP40_9BACT|nr:MAG: 50S ribosomal protein L7/L12 [Candidatus Giovannonibacteria bacterium RIFCSPHIGHO2_01_FULL_43_100]OGF66455.1 MAG: 50S ribosomal protein L7/L12 [Candidatus Giovannonibacteria bacterium RIFCSPHIGHO2_02_FULL_43_32]OGF77400.1 MAG: 50S ribosomal protein L7/L12 [Candidatus Giovannonibacteria bacterium RIFCSPHIGHO2_12_FULL_43_15]OGF78426.1 MAG: 50S ribosomal protein L7/L12 [Candidatus Giovannonibacteria bacterium RIFCSPLOWO2_01_FULL_43_60]OGF89785.1 MAG: 50S ribosomal protein L7/L12 [Candidatu
MADLEKIVDEVSKLTVLELSDLVKKIEEKFGVSAAMPVMAAGAGNVAGAEAEEEKSSFNVELKSTGAQKIAVIKVIREALGLGLAEAKGMADAAPKVVKEGLDKVAANELKAKLEAAGAVVELK